MHGREGEERKPRRHMWSVPALGTAVDVVDSTITATSDSFCKDGRKISVGDCALFKAPHETSPPFVGIIRWLTPGKDSKLKLGVNWLYRPADVELGKGILLEAAPNEVFYSFHKDEIPAASLLHPCKVSFLRKGVELPPRISSFVCRRVYDTTNKRLWWLTDQNYLNERQEEVDQLLDKTRLEMHATVKSGGRSPKPLNGPTSAPQLKSGSDGVQSSPTSLPSQGKVKKRERGDLGSGPVKRERSLKMDDGDSGHLRLESLLKSEITKIIDRGGLVDYEVVEKFVQLMQPDRAEKKLDLSCRIMLADVIAATDNLDCLGRFVQLRGLSVLDEWLQEVHKGKIGDSSSSPKECDKSVEEFLLALLRALDKLPVNLHALQTCNVGKSVNLLRSHKNLEIQKKARSLVDTWKKRVEVEMEISDVKPGSSQGVSWSSKQGLSEGAHGGSKRTGGSSEVPTKNSITQPTASKTAPVNLGHVTTSSTKLSASLPASVSKITIGSGTSDMPLTTIKEEKSSSSSQSQTNSQSCSSDHAKTMGSLWKEDARSSTAGSVSVSKSSSGVSRHRKSSNNGIVASAVSGVQKETTLVKCGSVDRKAAPEKVSQVLDAPLVDHGNNHRLIVKIPNPGRSPARSASGGSFDDPSLMVSRASSPGLPEKRDRKLKRKSDSCRANIAADVNTESWQSNDVKDEGEGSPDALLDERGQTGDGIVKSSEVFTAPCSSSGNEKGDILSEPRPGKSHEASFNSINALIEASASMPSGDDIGMNLLASVAAGEMSKADIVSPIASPGRSSDVPGDSFAGKDVKLRSPCGDVVAQIQGQPDDCADRDTEKQGTIVVPLQVKGPSSLSEEEPTKEHDKEQLHASSMNLQQTTEPCLKSDGKPDETRPASVPMSADKRGDGAEVDGVDQIREKRKTGDGIPDSKTGVKTPVLDEIKKVDHADVKLAENSMTAASDLVGGSVDDACGFGNDASSLNVKKDDVVEESSSCPPLEVGVENKSFVHGESDGGNSTEHKLPPMDHSGNKEGSIEDPNNADVIKVERKDVMEARTNIEQGENQRLEQVRTVPSSLDNQVSAVVEHTDGVVNSERKENLEDYCTGSTLHEEPIIPVQEDTQCIKSSAVEADKSVESAPVAGGSDVAAKRDFDLNEGFPVDEGSQDDPITSVVHLPGPLNFPLSSMSVSESLPASITVAAAAKGSFIPPENLSRNKGETGWKGSAATSAFRPAEPRKVLEMPLSTLGTPPDTASSKLGRPPLDFDLNVTDDRVLEDMTSHSAAQESSSQYGFISNRDCARSPAPIRSAGGLDLDLNKVDEDTDTVQFSASTSRKLEFPSMSTRSSSSGGFSNGGEVNVLRDFDLNNGPGLDEVGTEPAPPLRQQHAKSNLSFFPHVSGLRMNNNTELGNLSPWFPPGNSYPSVPIPEQSYPIVASAGTQRILGGPPPSFGPDVYRGPMLSSSPTMTFSPATTQFPYPGFPFGTNFPLPSTSFPSGSTTYMDSSSCGGLCFPAVPSQLVGTASMVSSHYPRPYLISLPDVASNGGAESSRKWVRQGLDLNAGPGGTDIVEVREERLLPTSSRQLSVASPQALAEEQVRMYQAATGALLKRKEPEGGWDAADRFSYKQHSWQ